MNDHSCSTCSGHGHLIPEPHFRPLPGSGTPVIELRGVSFAYDDLEVLSDVDLKISSGDFMAVIGPNGGGKTTLVKLILGLLAPKAGTVRVLGSDPKTVRPAVGYVPQHALVQPSFPVTVHEVVLLGLRREGGLLSPRRWPGYRGRDKEKAMEALRMVDMAELSSRRFDALSGGQKQRVLVARALVSDPALLIFDEPTSNIDPQGKLCLFDLLSNLSASITIVMVSHDLISASTRISSVAVVNRKLIQSTGRELTPSMLELIYGTHDASCPLDEYIKGVSSIFGQTGPRSSI
ncbi:MAG: metal ABC transporter ATP-binding protein [Desulfomicrobium sp.]|nr:metal ABC transporter ATP-binding protein [Desulfomicrobium sp.]